MFKIIDFTDVFLERYREIREPSGNLYATDIGEPIRHTQLRLAGAERKEQQFIDYVKMESGTLWHQYFEDKVLRGLPIIKELRVDDYLPKNWTGRLDWLVWVAEAGKFDLIDYKTKPTTYWVNKKGPDEKHQWQLSCYWHALNLAEYPLFDTFTLYYFPLNTGAPAEFELEPIEKSVVVARMKEITNAVNNYLKWVDELGIYNEYLWEIGDDGTPSYYCPYVGCGCPERKKK